MPFLPCPYRIQRKPLDTYYDFRAAEKIRGILKEADANGDNRLTTEEIKKAFSKLDAFFPALRAKLALNAADKNHDGVISGEMELDELIHYVFDRYAETLSEKNYTKDRRIWYRIPHY